MAAARSPAATRTRAVQSVLVGMERGQLGARPPVHSTDHGGAGGFGDTNPSRSLARTETHINPGHGSRSARTASAGRIIRPPNRGKRLACLVHLPKDVMNLHEAEAVAGGAER